MNPADIVRMDPLQLKSLALGLLVVQARLMPMFLLLPMMNRTLVPRTVLFAMAAIGITLWVLLSWHPVQHPWLGTKLLLLLLYIVLGSLALKRAPLERRLRLLGVRVGGLSRADAPPESAPPPEPVTLPLFNDA